MASISDQCKEIEENNRMGKTKDRFKKIRGTKGTFHAKMGSIKDRNGRDLREAELVAFPKGRLWRHGKGNYTADPRLGITVESYQPPVRSWQILPRFLLVQGNSPNQCPPPPALPPTTAQ